jgi:magnesium-protoporphyrin O-methyltransferase
MATRPPIRCCDADRACLEYDGQDAEADLRRWHAGALNPATQELIEVVRRDGVAGARLLDIGAGVGAVHVALLEAGAIGAIDVDASPDYLAVARAEAERRGLADRIDYRYGDVVELAPDLPPADIVTMDSVICCYRDLESLLAAATRSRPRILGLTYPRDVWWMRAFMRSYNAGAAARRSPARYFIHRQVEVDRWAATAGYRRIHEGGPRAWRVVVYRSGETAGE